MKSRNNLLLSVATFGALMGTPSVVSSLNGDDGDDHFSQLEDCGGEERWDIKVLNDNDATTINFTPKITTVNKLISLKTFKAASSVARQNVEKQVYTIKNCSIIDCISEDDNDLHLVLKDNSTNKTLIAEIPDCDCRRAALSGHEDEYRKVKDFFKPLKKGKKYLNFKFDITGVAYVDFAHGQTGHATNNIELHPVINIKFSKN